MLHSKYSTPNIIRMDIQFTIPQTYYGSNISEMLFKKGLCLPSGSNLTQQERDRISKVEKSLK